MSAKEAKDLFQFFFRSMCLLNIPLFSLSIFQYFSLYFIDFLSYYNPIGGFSDLNYTSSSVLLVFFCIYIKAIITEIYKKRKRKSSTTAVSNMKEKDE